MNITPILYHKDNCNKTLTIELVLKLLNQKYENINIDKLNSDDQKKVLNKSPIGCLPLVQVGDYFLSGTASIIKYFVYHNVDKKVLLMQSDDVQNQSLIEMWMDYTKDNLITLLEVILVHKNGKIILNEDKNLLSETKIELMNTLTNINNHLKFNTFMVGNSLSLADLFLASNIKLVYEKIAQKEDAEELNHLTRWFKHCSNLKEFKEIFGEVVLP